MDKKLSNLNGKIVEANNPQNNLNTIDFLLENCKK